MPADPRRPRRRLATTAPAAAAGAALLGLTLAGCGGSGGSAAPPPSPSLSPAAQQLSQLAAASRDSLFTARYAAVSNAGRKATVTVWVRSADRYRVDVAENGVTAALYGTAAGAVACTWQSGQKPACFLVAKPGKPIPSQFDAGVQRVFTRDLPLLAANPQSFVITEKQPVAATAKLAAARCFTITAGSGSAPLTSGLVDDVDLGSYCLSSSGPPRSLTFASGTLTLVAVGGAPAASTLKLPATPQPLPASASATPSH
ncbi:MAG TPA: hypothetical protein VHC41_08590 [Mycobacteriales bacterium]|nr:hypothetical protein [Mycobacteriales bacterium]